MAHITHVADLKPHDKQKTIEVKLYRRWIQRNPPDTTLLGYGCLLLDLMGCAIQAYATDIRHFNFKINVNAAYRVTKFVCEPARAQQQTVEHPVLLKFGNITDFKVIPATDFPNHYFRFITYDKLYDRAPSLEISEISRDTPVLTDYIGCVHHVSEIKNPTGKKCRNVDIMDISGIVLQATLWHDLATNFDKGYCDSLPKPVIIAITSCWVKNPDGKVRLSSSPATHCYLNPDVPEFHECITIFREKYATTPALHLNRNKYEDPEQEKFRNRRTIAFMLSENPSDYTGTPITCEGTILKIDDHRIWCYNACKTCQKKMDDLGDGIGCVNHDYQPDNHRYCFRTTFDDGTAVAGFTFFDEAGLEITGQPCQPLMSQIDPANYSQLPSILKGLEGTQHILQFEFGSSSPNKPHEFIVNHVFPITSEPSHETATDQIAPSTSQVAQAKRNLSLEPGTPAKDSKKAKD